MKHKNIVVAICLLLVLTICGNGQEILFDWQFNSENDGIPESQSGHFNYTIEDGVLIGSISGNDPWFNSPPDLNFDAGDAQKIKIRMKNATTCPALAFYWRENGGQGYSAERVKAFSIAANSSDFVEYIFDLKDAETWQNNIYQVRFDIPQPGADTGKVYIDYIQIIKNEEDSTTIEVSDFEFSSLKPLKNYSDENYFEVQSGYYQLIVDTEQNKLTVCDTSQKAILELQDFTVVENGTEFRANLSSIQPDLHVRRFGLYATELHLENVVFEGATTNWKGLGEISLYCYRDKIFVVLDGICNNEAWIVRDGGRYVYKARSGYQDCYQLNPSEMYFNVDVKSPLMVDEKPKSVDPIYEINKKIAVIPTVSAQKTMLSANDNQVQVSQLFDAVMGENDIREMGISIIFGQDSASVEGEIIQLQNPLSANNFTFEWGSFIDYYARGGIYRFLGRGPGNPTPAPGTKGGTKFTIQNDSIPRRIMVDSKDNWGGIAGGIVTDQDDRPMPLKVQFDLNYPEKGEYGENGGSNAVFPLIIQPNKTMERNSYSLFNQLPKRDLIFLNSLEPGGTGNLGIVQVSIDRHECHSTRQNPFVITDFRPHYNDVEGSSASASAMSYMTYVNQSGETIKLKAKEYELFESGPGLIEYQFNLETQDGKASGKAHVFQCATSDYTRVFSEVELHFNETVQLSNSDQLPLNFVRFDVGNPMVFRKFAFRGAAGNTVVDNLTNAGSGTVHLNGTGLSNSFFFSMYQAANSGGEEPGLTISDRSGNPAMIVYDWDVEINGEAINPAGYAFASGSENSYKRYITAIPLSKITSIQAGSKISYKLMQITGGDEYTDQSFAEDEYSYWPDMKAEIKKGEILSQFPIHIKAENDQADFKILNGYNRVPVKISGFASIDGLWAYVEKEGRFETTYAGEQSDAWYNTWMTEDSTYGVTFLVDKPDSEVPVRVKAITTEPDDDFFDLTSVPNKLENGKQLMFYPNPASSWIKIKNNHASISDLLIFDLRGVLVKQIRFSGSEKRIDLDLSPGTYLVNTRSVANEQSVVGKLVIVR